MNKFNNNRDEYRKRCMGFTLFMAGCVIVICWLLYTNMLRDDPDGMVIMFIGVAAAAIFAVWQITDMNTTLNIPENKADKISKSQLSHDWAIKYGVSFGSVYAGTMIIGTFSNGQLSEALPAIIIGCPLLGFIAYFIALFVANAVAPKEYLPWRTEEGHQAYLRREEERRRQAAIRAAQLAGRLQNTPADSPVPPTTASTESSTMSEIRGRIYQAGFSGSEVGYFTKDTVYKRGDFLSDSKEGTYRDGLIDDDSHIYTRNTIGRYVWDSVNNCYLIYDQNSKKHIGRVMRSGDIQVAKYPDGGALAELVTSTEYKVVGRYTGDPEGAAAAAYLLLLH